MSKSLRLISFLALAVGCALAGALTGCKASPDKASFDGAISDSQLHSEPDIPHAQLGNNIRPTAYALDLTIDPRADEMSGIVTISAQIAEPTKAIWVHAKNIEVSEAFAVQNEQLIPLRFTLIDETEAPSGLAKITSQTPLASGEIDITLAYSTPYNLALNSAYKVSRGEEDYILTQFEALGAREAFPSFDEPRFKVPFDLTINAPTGNVVYANTPLLAQTEKRPAWQQHVFARTQALPTYLIAFGVGPYDVAEYVAIPPNDIRTRTVELRGIAAKGEADNMDYALEHTSGLLTEFERYFGSQYPYEKLDLIAAPDFAFGAMENPGAIVYREYLLLLDEHSPQRQKDSYMRVHAHELAHQWFGNLVTPVWWEDIWLNEAFATWLGNKISARYEPDRGHERATLNSSLSAMELDSLPSVRAVQEPLLRSESVNDQFDAITYRKGGGVLSMIESYVGERAFRDGVHLYMERHKDDVASSDDFFAALADGADEKTIVSALKSFVDQPGLPLVSFAINETGKLTLSQSRYTPLGAKIEQGQSWTVPLCLRYGAAGHKAPSKECFFLDGREKTVSLGEYKDRGSAPDWVMPNIDGAGYYRFTLSPQLWTGLLDNLDQLSDRETQVVLDSLTSSFKAGQIEPSIFLDGIARFAALDDFETAESAGDVLSWMSDIIDESARPDLARFTRGLYESRYASVMENGLAKNKPAQTRGPVMAERLVIFGQDNALLDAYAAQGAAYLGLDGPADKQAVNPSFLKLALASALKQRGPEALDTLLALAQSGNAYEKSQAVTALGHAKDTETRRLLLDKIGPGQSQLTGGQSSTVLYHLMNKPDMRPMAWQWLKDNFDAFLDEKVADNRKARFSGIVGGCSSDERQDIETVFNSKASLMPGYERRLEQMLQTIDLCAALKEETGLALSKALNARP